MQTPHRMHPAVFAVLRAPRRAAMVLVSALAVTSLALTGCSAHTSQAATGGRVAVVASTSVYGDIASAVGGDAVSVVSILSDPSQDPHSFQADAQAQLALSRAVVVVFNGGGYDDFVTTLLRGVNNSGATIVNAVSVSGLDSSGPAFNEHVWYDFPAVTRLADRLARVFADRDPAHADEFTANAAAFTKTLAALEARESAISAQYAGEGVAITEPVPLYLLVACGLVDKVPVEFSRAVEAGSGVAPEVMRSTLQVITAHQVRLLVYNEQTSGPETEQLLAAAKTAGIPIVPVTETLPPGKTYLSWMSDNLTAVQAALQEGAHAGGR